MKHFSLLLVLLIACPVLVAAAEDMPVPWTVNVTHVAPKRVLVDDPIMGRSAYWYVVYEVTNPFDDPKEIHPEFEIVNKRGKRFIENLYPDAEKLAELRENEKLLDSVEMGGVIDPGETKRGIAIFRQIERDTNTFSMFISGLSAIQVQTAVEQKARATVKVFKSDYYWAGDRYHFDPESFELVGSNWIVRDLDLELNVPIQDVPKPE